MAKETSTQPNRYKAIIERIFRDHWKQGVREFEFERQEIKLTADALSIAIPDNIGDVVYLYSYLSG